MKYLINDTNIWIDLKKINMLENVFKLPYNICCPYILFYDELADDEGDLLLDLGLEVLEMSIEELEETQNLSYENRSISFNDSSALILAKQRNFILVTGDKALRKAAKKKSVDLKGTIWLIDELVDKSVIPETEGAECCRKLLAGGRRLPKSELESRIEKWGG